MKSFIALTKELLLEPGVKYFLSAKLNQDPLEEYFSKQRNMGGNNEAPTALQFGYNYLKLIVTGSQAVQAAGRGNIEVVNKIDVSDEKMPRRKRTISVNF